MRPLFLACLLLGSPAAFGAEPVTIDTPMMPPHWALLQRELIRANEAACREFYDRYFDDRGWLECVERWGGDDGPDDAIENLKDWPVLHALGGSDEILTTYKTAWEGHLRQYTLAKTTDVPFARDGMYYKEFPVMFDWLHNGEGLSVFNLQGLSDPDDLRFQHRVRRYAGFYLNEDPQAPNYDPKVKIIRSMFNGSRGPLLRKATAVDWAGDPIEVAGRFKPGHGERSYEEMLAHFKDYNDIVGDHPQNLQATNLAINAYMLDHEPRYRNWILEYVSAWRERMIANGNVIPTNIGLDGKIGGTAGGKWWGGVYGWGFTVIDPTNGKPVHRNRHSAGFQGFQIAYLLTGDDTWLDPWRKQIDAVNSHARSVNGVMQYPRMHGEQGWYDFTPEKYAVHATPLWYFSQKPEDRAHIVADAWVSYLEGKSPDWPETSLRADLDRVRRQTAAIHADNSTRDTRLADDSMQLNPCSVNSLIQQMLAGLPTGNTGAILFCQLRYFDPVARRAGLPPNVAALIEKLSNTETTVTLVNLDVVQRRTVLIQAGGYGEHQIESLSVGDQARPVGSLYATLTLNPGCGTRLTLRMKRFVNPPTLQTPW